MPLLYKPGQTVKVKHTTLAGKIEKATVNGDNVEYAVAYTDVDGRPQMRYFTEEQLELTV